ncbi:MAG: hypothetical protein R2828_17365 [Saprospiraceae bacterium]
MAEYSTSRQYHKKLAYLIETYELWRFDGDLMSIYWQLSIGPHPQGYIPAEGQNRPVSNCQR